MTTITEQKFTCNVNYQFDVSLQDLKDLFCTMGQGSYYWANYVTIGDIEEDEDGYYLPNQNYEHEGCCAWVKDLTLNTPIKIEDCEDEKHQFKVQDVLTAIEKIICGKTNLNKHDCGEIFQAFLTSDLGHIDASVADSILQIMTFDSVVYG